MQIHQWPDAAAFLERAGGFLEQREASHTLILGLAAELKINPQLFGSVPPFYATVEASGDVVLALLQTPPHALTLSLARPGDEDAALAALVEHLAGQVTSLPAISGPADSARRFADRWCLRTGQLSQVKLAMRIYELRQVQAPTGVPGSLRRADPQDSALVASWLRGFQEDALGETIDPLRANLAAQRWLAAPSRALYFWLVNQQPVAMVGVSGPTTHGIRVSAVFTPRELRGRGYASACVAAVSQLQLDSGRSFCTLFTDLANPTSNKIYQQVGYRPVCDALDIQFLNRGD